MLLAPLQIGCSSAVSCPLVLVIFPVQSLVDVAGYHPLVFPNKSGFRLKSGFWWIQWGS